MIKPVRVQTSIGPRSLAEPLEHRLLLATYNATSSNDLVNVSASGSDIVIRRFTGSGFFTTTYTSPANLTINLGAGNDTLNLISFPANTPLVINGDDGNDLIAEDDGANDFWLSVGSNFTVNGGVGDDTLRIDERSEPGGEDQWIVSGNQVTKRIASSFDRTATHGSVERVEIYGSNDRETFEIRSKSSPFGLYVNGGGGTDIFRLADVPGSEDLDLVRGRSTLVGGAGTDAVWFFDRDDTSPGVETYQISGNAFTKSPSNFEFAGFPETEFVYLFGNNGNSEYQIGSTFSGQNMTLVSGSGNDDFAFTFDDLDASVAGNIDIYGGDGFNEIEFDDTGDAASGDSYHFRSQPFGGTEFTKPMSGMGNIAFDDFSDITLRPNAGDNTLVFGGNGSGGFLNHLPAVTTVIDPGGNDTMIVDESFETSGNLYQWSANGPVFDYRLTRNNAGDFKTFDLLGIDNFQGYGTQGNDVVSVRDVNPGDSVRFDGMEGADTLYIGGPNQSSSEAVEGAAIIDGGDDHDQLIVLQGSQSVARGGAGNDLIDIQSGGAANAPVIFDGGSGLDTVLVNSDSVGRAFALYNRAQTLASLTLFSGARVTASAGGSATAVIYSPDLFAAGSLAVAPWLDANDNALIFPLADAAEADIGQRVANGYAGGTWNGDHGIRSSTAGAAGLSLGVVTGARHGEGDYEGIPVSPADVIVDQTLYGDFNLDKTVDLADFVILRNSFGQATSLWSTGDANHDGKTDLADFVLLRNNFGRATP